MKLREKNYENKIRNKFKKIKNLNWKIKIKK